MARDREGAGSLPRGTRRLTSEAAANADPVMPSVLENRIMKRSIAILSVPLLVLLSSCHRPSESRRSGAEPDRVPAATAGGSPARRPDVPGDPAPDEESYLRIRENFHQVRAGMAKSEVADLIGYPGSGRSTRRWTWEFTDTGMADKETYVVEFEDGRVSRKYCVGKHYARPEYPESGDRRR